MAVIERGKGKNRHSFEIVRLGTVLRSQEIDAGDERLPGYRRFASESDAAAALVAEVRGHLNDGMQPADDEARAIAASARAARPGAPKLPLRCDLAIYNEATGFVVTSRRMAGKQLDDDSAGWKKAVNNGEMVPIELIQDDPFIIRIVAGGPLTAQENAEWVSRIDWHLNVPDGRLCVTGGSVFTNEDYDPDESYSEQFVGELAIPKGRYRATLYGQFHGVNGGGALDALPRGSGKNEPVEKWFARTRPGEQQPDWENQELVDFLLHLEPLDAAPKKGLTELPDGGWFGFAANARKPELCPLGLVAKDVQRRMNPESGAWTYVRDVSALLGKAEPVSLQGGTSVALPASSLAAAARLGWLGSRFTAHELRLTPPKGASVDLTGNWPKGVLAVEEAGAVRILLSSDLEPGEDIARLTELAARIAAMPDGTILDARSAPVSDWSDTPSDAGKLILRGTLSGGTWKIARAFPAIGADRLEAGLKLAREINEEATILVKDAAEGKAIVDAAKKSVGAHLKANPPRVEGAAIRFSRPGREVALVGIVAYQVRFGAGAVVSEADDTDEDEDEDDDGMFPTEPVKGIELYTAPGGHVYRQTMALLLSMKIDTEVRKQEKALKKAGFREAGDVMCEAFDQIAFHTYLHTDRSAIAWFRVSYPDEVVCEVFSLFPAGQLLLTSQEPMVADNPATGLHVQAMSAAAPDQLAAEHEKRLGELKGALGAPREISSGVKHLAEALAVYVEKCKT